MAAPPPSLLPALLPGWVWLVGAGPGAPELLTLGAYQALRQADVVVHDALVDDGVLAFADPAARLEPVGKRAGQPSPTQDEINARLIARARAPARVVRLKGGDPFVFGRGPAEARALVRAGVPFRVVPGVPAGVGGLAYAGIPVTAGGVSDAVTFLTGSALRGDGPARLDWTAIARGSPVIVAYMAMGHLDALSARLRAGGRAADAPAAIVRRATCADQTVLETTLGRLATDAEAAGLAAPALVVIGEIVRLRAGLDWLGALGGRVLDPDAAAPGDDGRA
jgi:uroporphyrin-III C-methyltransferase